MNDAAATHVPALPQVMPVSGPPMTTTVPAKVVKAMLTVMMSIREIAKAGYNSEGRYEYIASEDFDAKLQDALVKARLVIGQREISRSITGKILFIKYEFDAMHEDGEAIFNVASHTGACRFEFKSGSTDDKAANKCHTTARKYALLHLFSIPPNTTGVERSDYDPDASAGDRDDDREMSRRRDTRHDYDDRRAEPPRSIDNRPPRDDRLAARGNGHAEPPPWGPPPDVDLPPDPGGPPEDRWGDPSPRQGEPGPAEARHRQLIMALKEALMHAVDEDAAHDIWRENAPLLNEASDATYEYLREEYMRHWKIYPPNIFATPDQGTHP